MDWGGHVYPTFAEVAPEMIQIQRVFTVGG